MNQIDELERLKKLFDKGVITKDEFQLLRNNVNNNSENSFKNENLNKENKLSFNKFKRKYKLILFLVCSITIILCLFLFIPKQNFKNILLFQNKNNTSKSAKNQDTTNTNKSNKNQDTTNTNKPYKKQDKNIVYIDGKEVGRIVKKEFIYSEKKYGFVFKIPDGKIWTPLYYEFEDLGNNYAILIPNILTEKYTGKWAGKEFYLFKIYDDKSTKTWWYRDRGVVNFYEKETYHSIKFCKQNKDALSGLKAIYCYGRHYNVRYKFYFFEESITYKTE